MMSMIKSVNISLQIWGAVLLLIILVCVRLNSSGGRGSRRCFMWLLGCNSVILLSDAASWCFKGQLDLFSKVVVRVANFLVFALGYVLMLAFTEYLTSYLSAKTRVSRKPLYLVRCLCVMAVVSVVISQFNHMYYLIDENNMYCRQRLYWFSQVGGIACMFIEGGLLIKYRQSLSRKEFLIMGSYIVLPVIAMSIQIMVYGLALLNIATTVSMLFIYIGIQIEQAVINQERELELAQTRIAMMISQIQPHFLYNALTAIRQLCLTRPELAAQAVESFSYYLRGNMDALSQKSPVPFSRELEHLENYLMIEKLRFPNLKIIYHLQAEAFELPSLTLQPLVENSIRHGIKAGAGKTLTVTISTWEDIDALYLQIDDNGRGFDPERVQADGRSHVGISNTRSRIEKMCGGKLYIESVPEKGTRVTVRIPKEEEQYESDSRR